SSVAGHPLRPANDQSLGRPLPYQLANRARAPPPTTYAFESSNLSPRNVMRKYLAFRRVIPHQRADYPRVTHPCAVRHFRIATKTRTRLACVKHAASVRSEPGSNSRLKPVAWRKKMLRFSSEPAYQANYCRSIYSNHSRSKRANGTNGFWHIVSIVKER